MSTHNIPLSIKRKKITLIYPKSAAMGFCSKGLKNEFETAMVNEPSVFEPLKFYCIFHKILRIGPIDLSIQCRSRSDSFQEAF